MLLPPPTAQLMLKLCPSSVYAPRLSLVILSPGRSANVMPHADVPLAAVSCENCPVSSKRTAPGMATQPHFALIFDLPQVAKRRDPPRHRAMASAAKPANMP